VSRPLEANEQDVLLKVLDTRTFEGSAELPAQVYAAVVVSGPPTFLKLDERSLLGSCFRRRAAADLFRPRRKV